MKPLVVDASVAFKWLVPDASEDDVPSAKALLLDHHEQRCMLTVPALLYYEVGNILLFGRMKLTEAEAESALADLFALPLQVMALDSVASRVAARLSHRYRLSYYDASYLAAAEALETTLITADRRLARRAEASHRVRLLGSMV